MLSLKAKLLEGDLGAKCSGGKYAAALLNEMGKQVTCYDTEYHSRHVKLLHSALYEIGTIDI